MIYKNVPMVSKVVFGRGSFSQLPEILSPLRLNSDAPFLFIVDKVFQGNSFLTSRIPLAYRDEILYVSVDDEPTTYKIDEITEDIILRFPQKPSAIIGIGGGSVLDIAKAVSIMLTNPGNAESYLGIGLVRNAPIYHIGIPTLSGTGAEVSNKSVLIGGDGKSSIVSDYITFDQVILDPELIQNVPQDQWFYSAADCFIQSVESEAGHYSNALSTSHAREAMKTLEKVLLREIDSEPRQEQLMLGSWHSGLSALHSNNGICRALSFGLIDVLGLKHAISNCIVFNALSDYFPEKVEEFKQMMLIHNIDLPQNLSSNLSDSEIKRMAKISINYQDYWKNAFGNSWKTKFSLDDIIKLYNIM